MEGSEYNVKLLFEELNYKLTQGWKLYTDLEMKNIKQLGIYWEK